MTRLHMALIATAMGISPVAAQTIDCATAQVQMQMTVCAQRDWRLADADLTEAYRAAQAAMKRIDANLVGGKRGASASLRDAERAWIGYRDAACLSESFSWQGGSGEQMVVFACRARITRARAADLWMMTRQGG